jgi:hypothetical protein
MPVTFGTARAITVVPFVVPFTMLTVVLISDCTWKHIAQYRDLNMSDRENETHLLKLPLSNE